MLLFFFVVKEGMVYDESFAVDKDWKEMRIFLVKNFLFTESNKE